MRFIKLHSRTLLEIVQCTRHAQNKTKQKQKTKKQNKKKTKQKTNGRIQSQYIIYFMAV